MSDGARGRLDPVDERGERRLSSGKADEDATGV